MFIIDHLIYKDDHNNKITDILVYEKQLIFRLRSIEEDLRLIVINILSNLVINPDYKKFFHDLINPIRMMLKCFPELMITYTFINNYFKSQEYFIITESDWNLIDQLRNL